MMSEVLSIILSLFIIILALKIALKVTGCLLKLIIFGAAFWFIIIILNLGFNILAFLF